MRNALPRRTYLVFRYGGEGFCALLPNMRSADAVDAAERLRASVQGLALPHANAPAGIVSVSIGVASHNQRTHTDYGQMIQAADDALYEAKHAGRNIVRASVPAWPDSFSSPGAVSQD